MIFAEFFCALAVTLGLLTRLAVIPLIFGMSVAFFVYHGSHSFDKKELSYLYLTAFTVIFFLGAGRFSLDEILFNRKSKEEME
ncbi:MAG: DoxX family protein [Blastocatellia bacterium]|nr:DoxX family protein [Blastocatellia bacterium]